MDIPTDIEGWLEGGSWSEDHVPFNDEELQKAPPFQRYSAGKSTRDIHEMSHLVYVDDEHMFHPMWGEALPDTWPVDPEGARREACVFAIESVIKAHIMHGIGQDDHRAINVLVGLTIKALDPEEPKEVWEGRREAFRAELDALMSITVSEWPIERIWAELQRKYRLVNSWTPGEEIDQATTDAQLAALCTIFGINS